MLTFDRGYILNVGDLQYFNFLDKAKGSFPSEAVLSEYQSYHIKLVLLKLFTRRENSLEEKIIPTKIVHCLLNNKKNSISCFFLYRCMCRDKKSHYKNIFVGQSHLFKPSNMMK